MSIISVIVPVYKVEKYLERCVRSLINQSLKDIEIILVDDGSPDESGVICDNLKRQDNRIQVIHKKNGGLSSARNAGMKVARGKYIGFVDSDDDVELDMFEIMVDAAEKYSADFVMSDYIRILDSGKHSLITTNLRSGCYEKGDIKKDIFPTLIMAENIDYGPILSVWHCIYNREFLQKNHILFADDVKWSEDNLFNSIAGYCAERLVYLKGQGLYHYYQNPGTITTTYRKGAWEVYSKMNQHMHEFFDPVKDYDFGRQLKLHMIYYACNCIGQEVGQPEDQAINKIREILHSKQLQDAFVDFTMPKVNFKLRVQLYLMKWKEVNLLYQLKR